MWIFCFANAVVLVVLSFVAAAAEPVLLQQHSRSSRLGRRLQACVVLGSAITAVVFRGLLNKMLNE